MLYVCEVFAQKPAKAAVGEYVKTDWRIVVGSLGESHSLGMRERRVLRDGQRGYRSRKTATIGRETRKLYAGPEKRKTGEPKR